tara:strand:- start:1519 stop:2274 length:756 start_codon:yes stop_codon:yes gene_type:complete
LKFIGLITVLISGSLLIIAVSDFPNWGDPASPASSYRVSNHYITESFAETSVPNLVTAVLADYRGYDTLFETVVIFAAGIAILAILGTREKTETLFGEQDKLDVSGEDLIIDTTVRLIVPVIQLFGLYVIAHGHSSPGGGFQGGIIFGSSLILLSLARNLPYTLRRLSQSRAVLFATVGVLIYAGIGLLCLILGSNFLDYSILGKLLNIPSIQARSLSIFGVEVGVGFTVATVMFVIFANLSSRGRLQDGL